MLDGYPRVALLDQEGQRLPFGIRHDGDQVVTSRPPRPVRIRPRESAVFVLSKYRCDLGVRDEAKSMRVGLPGSRTTSHVTLAIPDESSLGYCGKDLPGSTFTVSPIVRTFEDALAVGE
jgi:hypothetical protein